jgi:nicotinate-nucleotide adenylyltransferase
VSDGPLGVFGGTFNPIHNGHLRSAVEVRESLGLERVLLMPAARPPLRELPECDAAFRADLVELAVAGEPGLICDRRELRREGPSFTFDTLAELRIEHGPDCSLALILGTDTLEQLDRWYRWEELLTLAHLIIVARPGWSRPESGAVARWLSRHLADVPDALHSTPCGSVVLKTLRQLPISATEIRQIIADGRSPRYLLPDAVWRRIQDSGVYRAHPSPQEQHGIC